MSHCAAPAAENVLTGHPRHCSDDTAPGVEDWYPAPHLEHVVALSCALYDPAEHSSHVSFAVPRFLVRNPTRQWQSDCRVLPMSDVALPWHAVHTSLDVAASAEEYVLFPHKVHALGPISVLYVPCTHPRHTSPSAPVYPALHRQSIASSLPSGDWENEGQLVHVETTCATVVEYSFKTQFTHVPMPTPVLYVPAMHATHSTPSSAPEYPALQEQFVRFVLASNENVFAGQSRHMLSDVAAVSVPYLPAAQSVHASLPRSGLYVPGGHA